ncbi:ATP-NAD kinase-like domain-containing protein [Endogone sp. FLAS-F59071]|nr:ATP-NAD kinase-like domain-containing protein [Endogone sp. FLAS-F59071]|eukprot:RUS13639.1 ATP-NAD kinase-like domain-containing protein [Endogone sp. FLAS-F59071]
MIERDRIESSSQTLDHYERVDLASLTHFFLFINPKSGNNQGKQILQLGLDVIQFKSHQHVKVHVHNLFDDSDRDSGFDSIKSVLESKRKLGKMEQKTHLCVAGGDGTLTFILSHLESLSIPTSELFFSLLPFGTGNDLARFLGTWHLDKQATRDVMRGGHLLSLVTQQLHGHPQVLDVWDVTIVTDEAAGGGVRKFVSRGNGSEDGLGPPVETLRQKMINNLAVGAQAYVGGDFEGHRTKSRVLNIAWYVAETIKWGLFRKLPPVSLSLERIENVGGEGPIWATVECEKSTCVLRRRQSSLSHRAEPSLNSKNDPTSSAPTFQPRTLAYQPIELDVQNIPSLWGRLLNLWDNAEAGSAFATNSSTMAPPPTDPQNWVKQSASDRKLEVFVIEHRRSYMLKELALDRKNLARIGQFNDGVRIVFRDEEKEGEDEVVIREEEENPPVHGEGEGAVVRTGRSESNTRRRSERSARSSKKEVVVRVMVDGEFYEVKRPRWIEIKMWEQITIMGPPQEKGH